MLNNSNHLFTKGIFLLEAGINTCLHININELNP